MEIALGLVNASVTCTASVLSKDEIAAMLGTLPGLCECEVHNFKKLNLHDAGKSMKSAERT